MGRGRPAGSRNIPWDDIVARLREHPGRWMLPKEMIAVNIRTVNVIRKRERRALRLTDGVIRCRRKDTVDTGDAIICTLWLQFQPKETP